jgi:2-polyprenyl-3-methyl-5-hydroxy-6-metoxy-1,4-benzoquinol methylase
MAEHHTPLLRRLRNSFEYRTGVRLPRSVDRPRAVTPPGYFPADAEALLRSELFNSWWYYSIELLPGLVTKGIYHDSLPFLPRMMLRRCELEGMSCLDLGSMEGLIPVLMSRGGAREVTAIDAVDHCLEKLQAVKHYYGVDFKYESVGPMYDLHRKLQGHSFDLINCSGLLYHLFSPMTLLGGLRPLLKRNGLLIVSTNIVIEEGFTMDFNNAGRMQSEANTFWYLSVKLFDYLLRYLKLAPVDYIFLPHTSVQSNLRFVFNKPSGYLCILCRATDELLATPDDTWLVNSQENSWEYKWVADWNMAANQPASNIEFRDGLVKQFFREEIPCLDLWSAVRNGPRITSANSPLDSHTLHLSDKV